MIGYVGQLEENWEIFAWGWGVAIRIDFDPPLLSPELEDLAVVVEIILQVFIVELVGEGGELREELVPMLRMAYIMANLKFFSTMRLSISSSSLICMLFFLFGCYYELSSALRYFLCELSWWIFSS